MSLSLSGRKEGLRRSSPAQPADSHPRLTRLQLDEIGRERDLQRQGAQQAEARAERAVELAQERVVRAPLSAT